MGHETGEQYKVSQHTEEGEGGKEGVHDSH